jgi:citrate synthase
MANAAGLEGVVAAETALSDVDGERGRLILAGHDVESLAPRASFEEATALLWQSAGLPADELRAGLGLARVQAATLLPGLTRALSLADGMDALRASLAQLETSEPLAVLGAVPVFAAAWARARRGLPAIAPDPARGQADDFLRLLRGEPADAARVRALDTYLVTVADHGMNASTFAARVVTSTGSDVVSATVAAIGALKGPLHGGAPGPVLDMLDGIGSPPEAEAWLRGELAAGRRIMGMGHRVYRVRDPRAAVLEAATQRLEAAIGTSAGRLPLARAVERAATALLGERHKDRSLAANVEFYTAVLLDAVGLDRTLFSPTFAIGRTAGWLAHMAEQRATGRLIRPASRYVGAWPAGLAQNLAP